MTKHTPGPWFMATMNGNIKPFGIQPLNGGNICDMSSACVAGTDYTQEERTKIICANAALIAAAPELYEACKFADEVLRRLDDNGKYEGSGIQKELCVAIAKAEGVK